MSHSGIQRLTFVGNDADLASAATAYGAIASGTIGIWDVDAATYLSASESFLVNNFVSATSQADAGAVNVALPSAIVPKRFQIVQGQASGNPKCSPIIYSDDVIKINMHPDTPSAAALASFVATGANIAVGEIHSYKFVITSLDTEYQGFIDPSNDERPSYVGQVINYERVATSAVLDTEFAALETEFNAIDNMPFTAAYTAGTDTLVFTAKQEGVNFKLLGDFSGLTAAPTSTAITNTGFVLGNGDGRIIAGYEKMSRAYFGRHNNIYLPMEETLYADAADDYFTITLTWDQSNKGHANPWLFTGENSILIAVPDGLSTETNWNNAFGNINIGTADTELYNKHNRYVG